MVIAWLESPCTPAESGIATTTIGRHKSLNHCRRFTAATKGRRHHGCEAEHDFPLGRGAMRCAYCPYGLLVEGDAVFRTAREVVPVELAPRC